MEIGFFFTEEGQKANFTENVMAVKSWIKLVPKHQSWLNAVHMLVQWMDWL